jgi:hypothetical protein
LIANPRQPAMAVGTLQNNSTSSSLAYTFNVVDMEPPWFAPTSPAKFG